MGFLTAMTFSFRPSLAIALSSRFVGQSLVLAIMAGLFCGAAALPAWAQSADRLIAAGQKAIAKGKYSTAIRHFTRAMRVEDLTQEQLARAFYQRGRAYHKAGRYAESIADITRAVWFNKLSAADRKAAYQIRAQAYQALGFMQNAKADFRRAGRSAAVASNSQTPVKTAQAATPPAKNTSGGFFANFFGFGGGDNAKSASDGPEKQLPLTGWGAAVKVKTPASADKGGKPQIRRGALKTPVRTASVNGAATSWQTVTTRNAAVTNPRSATGSRGTKGQRYAVQIASVRSQSDAVKLWRRMKARHGALLANKKPMLVRADLGEKGIFYRVQISPAGDKASTRRLCEQMKAQGTYCFLVRR